MASKKVKEVVTARDETQYRLDGDLMVQLQRGRNVVDVSGRFLVRAQLRQALTQKANGVPDAQVQTYRKGSVFQQGPFCVMNSEYALNGISTPREIQRFTGGIAIGCQVFNKADTDKLYRWVKLGHLRN